MGKLERLDKVISNMGYGSRKDIKKYVKDGIISVNGQVVKKNDIKVDPYEDEIVIDGELVHYREFIYLMMNKPQGLVSSTDDPTTPTVIDSLDYEYLIFEPFPVGRLDKDTEGLLIISNDGKFAHEILSPKNGIKKKYYVEYDGELKEDAFDRVRKGITLDDGYTTLPAELEEISYGSAYITIQEGKYHQVKRMFGALGCGVTFLKRLSMGDLQLDESLNLGEYRELEEDEIKLLKNS